MNAIPATLVLDNFPSLTKLKLSKIQYSTRHKDVCKLKHLTALSVARANLEFLSSMIQLRTLNIRANTGITDDGLQHLSALTNLTRLKLPANVSGKGFKHLGRLAGLTSLKLNDSQIDDDGIEIIAHQHLHLRRLSGNDCAKITDRGIAHLTSLTLLTGLDLVCFLIRDVSTECVLYSRGAAISRTHVYATLRR